MVVQNYGNMKFQKICMHEGMNIGKYAEVCMCLYMYAFSCAHTVECKS